MTTRTIIEYTGTVEPMGLSAQVEAALEDADDAKVEYQSDSFNLTRFETDHQNPLLATGEGEAVVSFYQGVFERVRVMFETRRASGELDSDEIGPAEVYLTVREFNG